ncbi:MAG TPA: hypothetical protein VFO16_23770 [Pseudonocardiaceae bacterium]|nr:hypothetical protein [Pseudonocardiaceae bacterium]
MLAAIARARKAGPGAHTRLLTTTRLVVHKARLWQRGSRLLPSPIAGVPSPVFRCFARLRAASELIADVITPTGITGNDDKNYSGWL